MSPISVRPPVSSPPSSLAHTRASPETVPSAAASPPSSNDSPDGDASGAPRHLHLDGLAAAVATNKRVGSRGWQLLRARLGADGLREFVARERELEERSKRRAAEALERGKVKAVVATEAQLREIPKHMQGNADMYTDEAVHAREALRVDMRVHESIVRWWHTVPKNAQGLLEKKGYLEVGAAGPLSALPLSALPRRPAWVGGPFLPLGPFSGERPFSRARPLA